MGNRGVLLYVDLGKLEDEPYRLSKIYDTLGQYIDDIRRQRDIIYISKMAESLDISSLDRYRAQLVDEYDRLGTLKKILDEAYDLYKNVMKNSRHLDRLCATYMLKLHGMRPVRESWL